MQLLLILSLLFMVDTNGKGCQASENEEQAPPQKRQKRSELMSEVPQYNTLRIEFLPTKLWVQIFDELTFQELKKAKSICKSWQFWGDDPFFSLASQVRLKPLAIILRKLQRIESKYYQELFGLPLVHRKLLAEPVALGNI